MSLRLSRRLMILCTAIGAALLGACASPTVPPTPSTAARPPIVFVHGNGDTAGLWITTLWRFESNGWPRERLHAIDIPYPLARDDDGKPQEGRSSTLENMQFLSAEVDKLLAATGAKQVVLIANSRGGNAVRNYIANGGGAAKVSHAILGGTPDHGVYADPMARPGSEFNGAGPFLLGLNAPKGAAGDEVTPGVKWLTIRSDYNDKFAQPEVWGAPQGTPSHVTFDGPALKGADNVVIPGIDHRETAYSAQAFEQMVRFIAGNPALPIAPEVRVVLDGKVSGYLFYTPKGVVPTNLPLAGAIVEVYPTNPATGERMGAALHRKPIGADGMWGPFAADGRTSYEFVTMAPGYATTHIYRSPFARSSDIVNLRVEHLLEADKDALAIVTLTRPRGYFGVPRDRIEIDGKSPPPGIPSGVPGIAAAKVKVVDTPGRAVAGEFNGERIVGRAWPAANDELSILELTY